MEERIPKNIDRIEKTYQALIQQRIGQTDKPFASQSFEGDFKSFYQKTKDYILSSKKQPLIQTNQQKNKREPSTSPTYSNYQDNKSNSALKNQLITVGLDKKQKKMVEFCNYQQPKDTILKIGSLQSESLIDLNKDIIPNNYDQPLLTNENIQNLSVIKSDPLFPEKFFTSISTDSQIFKKKAQKQQISQQINTNFKSSQIFSQKEKTKIQSIFDVNCNNNNRQKKMADKDLNNNIFLKNTLLNSNPFILPQQLRKKNVETQSTLFLRLFQIKPTQLNQKALMQKEKLNQDYQSPTKNNQDQNKKLKKEESDQLKNYPYQKPVNIFFKNTTQKKQQSIFKNSFNLFQPSGQTPSIFKNLKLLGDHINTSIFLQASKILQKDNLFQKKKQVQSQSEQQEYQQEQNENIEGKEQFDPTKSTGIYKYQEKTTLYQETIQKFKRGNSNLVQNAIISIQKCKDTQKHLLCVRLPNKCNYFIGTILPCLTQASKINQNDYRNLKIIKIPSFDKDNQLKLEILKVQFKQPVQGETFLQKFKQALAKAINQQS